MTYIQGGGGGGAPTGATYIVQTANAGLSAEQALSTLSTGVVKVTTGTGVLSTAVAGTDYAAASHAHAASDITSGTVATARLGSGSASATTFLRGDQTWAAALGATTVEVNLGSPPLFQGKFTIVDAAISGTSKVLCWQAPGPYTGKGTLADEACMQPVNVTMVNPGSGSATVCWETPPMVATSLLQTAGSPLGAGTQANSGTNRQPQIVSRRLGRIRGNVKFSYLILS